MAYVKPVYKGKNALVHKHDLGFQVVDFAGNHMKYVADLETAKDLADNTVALKAKAK